MAAGLKHYWERILEKYKETYSSYRKWVYTNPQTVSQIEQTFRFISYLVAGRLEQSPELAELVFAASNLLVLFNDGILRNAYNKVSAAFQVSLDKQDWLKMALTVIDCVEVYVEITARRLWGPTGKWVVIAAVQILKTVLRALLLLRYGCGMQASPPLQPLNREVATSLSQAQAQGEEGQGHGTADLEWCQEYQEESGVGDTFVGQRSGRVVRSLNATPPMKYRMWKAPEGGRGDAPPQPATPQEMTALENSRPTQLTGHRLLGESIYIGKPLVHLLSLYVCGEKSWKPWLLSSGLDATSLTLLSEKSSGLNNVEKNELRRRTLMLLFYLLRSPFYDKYSKTKILAVLRSIAKHIPGTGLIIGPLIEYLPYWQKVYFYNWGS